MIKRFWLLVSFALLACSPAGDETNVGKVGSLEPDTPPAYQREAQPWLTHDESRLRSATVGDTRYDLAIDLTGREEYQGVVAIQFDYSPLDNPLTLDFVGGSVISVEVGGQPADIDYNGYFISIPAAALKQGENRIVVRYRHPYSNDGNGLYRFTDGSDGRTYLYTHFEPYHANHLHPMFDQPDLRARWTLRARVPADWTVISSVRESEVSINGAEADWKFPESPAISSYIFPLHAGPYYSWDSRAGDVPLRLFARQSLAEDVRADWWFDLTTRGMVWFQDYFDVPYPFEKYDQIIVPDFNIGGMENVAAVTYTENYVPRGQPTRERLQAIADTILHELSHMWFGDLVTIDWWNALWLKESFASIMSPMVQAAATDFDETWLAFYLVDKQAAYNADQLVTTHSIEMPVRDTKSGSASFDDITYEKGASVLKQLTHYLGEDAFREGVRAYMNQHAWSAATLPDFIDGLAAVSGRDLSQWSDEWLKTAGLNTVRAKYSCEDGTVADFRLLQAAPEEHPVLRTHRLQVGFYELDESSQLSLADAVDTELRGVSTAVPDLDGRPCPLLIYPNTGDWAFVKVQLDDNSLERVPELLNRTPDPLLRSMLWQSIWDAVTDLQIPLSKFIDIALEHMPGEQDTTVLNSLLRRLTATKDYLNRFPGNAEDLRDRYLPAMESMALAQTLASENGSGRQKLWFDVWVSLAVTEEAQTRLEQWLAGSVPPVDLSEDQDRRWQALQRLAVNGYSNTGQLLEIESARDPSESGRKARILANAALPDPAEKARTLERINDTESGEPAADLKAALPLLFPSDQQELQRLHAEDILRELTRLDTERDQEFIEVYVKLILPKLCTTQSVSNLDEAISNRGNLGLIASKGLLVAHQNDQLCVDMAALQLGQP